MSATVRAARRYKRPLELVVAAFLLAGLPDVLARAWPASIWYELDDVHVSDAPDFDAATVTVQRKINRPFVGAYRVYIWPADMSAPVCKGGDTLDYHAVSSKVISKSTAWWAANQIPPCSAVMPPDYYRMSTCIEIHPQSVLLSWMPPPRVCEWSNIFKITGG